MMKPDFKKALSDARRGAEIACELMMRRYRGKYAVYTKEGAGDRAGAVLTEADLECDAAMQEYFTSLYPDHAVVSEESVEKLPEGWVEREWVWYIDPIDGSLSYLEGTDNFGVSISLTHRGEAVLGVLSNPARGLHAWAVKGEGAFVNGKRVGIERAADEPPRLMLSSTQSERYSYRRLIELLAPSRIVKLESVVTKAILLLQDEADYYFSLPFEVFKGGCPSAWDFAGSAAIVSEAGWAVSDIYGEPMRFDGLKPAWTRGHLFAKPEIAGGLLATLGRFVEQRREAGDDWFRERDKYMSDLK
jgi:fructose-1,6-bisphosphatase/inositol monophosphatase family enzyme